MSNKQFYIGWRDSLPERQRKALRRLLIPVFTLLPVLAFLLIYFMKPFNDHQFEFGNVKTFTGIYYEDPFPVLVLEEGQEPDGFDRHALLVGYGKAGAKGFMQKIEEKKGQLSGKKIRLQGTLIYGDGRTLIELTQKEESVLEVLESSPGEPPTGSAAAVQLEGEIMDPKCWFGVMKPAEGKVHKSCAIRCVSGGIPPVLKVPGTDGFDYYVLKGQNGEDINQEILQFIGEPVVISGRSFEQHGWQVLQIAPADVVYLNNAQ